MNEIAYVLGFAVDPECERVLLIKKKHGPSFLAGRWNGLGGKIEEGEGPRGAMAREFYEECGIQTDVLDWAGFHIETHLPRAEQILKPRMYCMTTMLTNEQFCAYEKNRTDEPVFDFKVLDHDFHRICGVYNLGYLLEMVRVWHLHSEHRWLEG